MVTLALGFLVAPLAADAQPRIAFLGLGTAPPASALPPVVAGFQQGLRELGWVEGQNLTIEWRWAEGSLDRFATLGMDPSFTAAIPFKSSSRTGPRNASIWSVCRCMPRSSILTRASGNSSKESSCGICAVSTCVISVMNSVPRCNAYAVSYASSKAVLPGPDFRELCTGQ